MTPCRRAPCTLHQVINEGGRKGYFQGASTRSSWSWTAKKVLMNAKPGSDEPADPNLDPALIPPVPSGDFAHDAARQVPILHLAIPRLRFCLAAFEGFSRKSR